jgi:hypothetical protein
MKYILLLSVVLLSACTTPVHYPADILSSEVFDELPNWYDDRLGLQLQGNNQYPSAPHGVLLQQADLAFAQNNLQNCQIYLERAQRIATRDASIYVRLSYLYWLQEKPTQALQTARRALSVVGQDELAKKEIQRLIASIKQN